MFRAFLLLLFSISLLIASEPITYRVDDAHKISMDKRVPSSHLKVYLPSIPYSYIMRLINGTLVRLSDNKRGWEYFLAKSHIRVDELTYDFELREDVKFQDGSSFDADSVVENFKYFKKGAFTYTDIHHKLYYVQKLSKYKIRIHLNKPYGMLLNDLARINLYTSKYLQKYAWSKNIAAENTKVPGAYGSGPYILASGNVTGLKQSDKVVLKANPYFFEKPKPYIETITIYTKLPMDEVIEEITKQEGKLDIAVIPFDRKTEIVNSEYAKLVSVKSSGNFSIHINLMNPKSKLQDVKIRQALNQAINQDRLIKFVYKNEGSASPFLLSSNSYYAKELSKEYLKKPKKFFTDKQLHEILNNVELKVVTQDRFESLWKGLEYQLSQYGVRFSYDVTTDESFVLNKLLTNRSNVYDWDLLIWGNADWYGHPWTVFFNLYTKNQWSGIKEDEFLDAKFREFFEIDISDKTFQKNVNDILKYTYDKAYMLAVPSPNVLLALNKEVDFLPSSVAILKLWNAKITPYHWSVRTGKPLHENRKTYIFPTRINDE